MGEKSLHKIVAQVGDHIKKDEATRNIDKLQYARVLVEMNIDQDFPSPVNFINEVGEKTMVPMTYEWRPVRCWVCSNFGHESKVCRA